MVGYVIHGWQRYQRYTQAEDSLEDAIAACYWAINDETFSPSVIMDNAGNVVLVGSALDNALDKYATPTK